MCLHLFIPSALIHPCTAAAAAINLSQLDVNEDEDGLVLVFLLSAHSLLSTASEHYVRLCVFWYVSMTLVSVSVLEDHILVGRSGCGGWL